MALIAPTRTFWWCILRESANSIKGTLRAMVYTDGAGLDIVHQRCWSSNPTRSQRGYGKIQNGINEVPTRSQRGYGLNLQRLHGRIRQRRYVAKRSRIPNGGMQRTGSYSGKHLANH